MFLGLLMSLGTSPCFASEAATINDVWFMRGRWNAEVGINSVVKEQWVKTDDHTLTGNCIFLELFSPSMPESTTITETKNGLVLRAKYSSKDCALGKISEEVSELLLVEHDLNHAVFDNQQQKNRLKITYRWSAKDRLTAKAEGLKEGTLYEFAYYKINKENDLKQSAPVNPNKLHRKRKW